VRGCTIGSRGEVPEERKPVTRDNDDDDDANTKNLLYYHAHFKSYTFV
jgi:hypothetical protein